MKDEELSGLCEVVRMELNRRAKQAAEEAKVAGKDFKKTRDNTYEGLIKRYFGTEEDEPTYLNYSFMVED